MPGYRIRHFLINVRQKKYGEGLDYLPLEGLKPGLHSVWSFSGIICTFVSVSKQVSMDKKKLNKGLIIGIIVGVVVAVCTLFLGSVLQEIEVLARNRKI